MKQIVIRPLGRFLQIQAASGIVLLIAAGLAIAWANSPWSDSYDALWHTAVRIGFGSWTASASLHFVINDILMAVFFFVVGLEIRREMHSGELSDLRRASLPIIAAVGGMLIPALLYMMVSPGGDADRGWGVPMATDIAFAVGVLALLGKRVPPSLRVLLLAVAIIDDIGAIIVIALFYSSGVELAGIAIAVFGILGTLLLQRFGTRTSIAYIVPAVVTWVGVLQAGIHPTIAGVIVGLLTPARAWYGPARFLEIAHHSLHAISRQAERQQVSAHDLQEPLTNLRLAQREAVPPVERLEAALHPWVAFGIMPLFALANAGINFGALDLTAAPGVAIGITLGLVVGKTVGIVAASALAVRLGIARLPRAVTWRGVVVVGMVAGIGFTMALFIAGLAFADRPDLHGIAKLGVVIASAIAAILTLIVGRVLLRPDHVPGAAETVDEAEASTEN